MGIAATDATSDTPGGTTMEKDDRDNHANQLNPEHDAYWQSRGYDERPDDGEDQLDEQERAKP
jgi:hypothetical protein